MNSILIAFIMYSLWMVLGYLAFGIIGILLGFIFVFLIRKAFVEILEMDISEALSNSIERPKEKSRILDEFYHDDSWDD